MSQEKGSSLPRLTVATIARQAAQAVAQTIASIRHVADEIIVINTGDSSDDYSAAKRAGAIVEHFSWTGDFSAARNFALTKVTGDWILWLDAGETMAAEEAEQLKEFLLHGADATQAYLMLVRVPKSVGNMCGEQVARVRLMPNLAGLQFTGRVRESLDAALEKQGIALEGLPWRIDRDASEHEPMRKILKARRDAQLADLEMKEHGFNARMLNCLANALSTVGEVENAGRCFRQAIALSERGSLDMLEAYYGLLTALDGQNGGVKAQMAVCLEALEIYSLDSQLLCAMGGYLQSQGQVKLAARSYETAYRHGQVHPLAWHLDEVNEIAASCFALSLQIQGQEEDAATLLAEAIGQNPQSQRLRRQKIELDVKHGRRSEAIAEIEQMRLEPAQAEQLRTAVRGACLAGQGNWIAAEAFLMAAYQSGCRDALLMRWMIVSLLAMGRREQAHSVLTEWQRLDPANMEMAQIRRSMETMPTAAPAPAATAPANAGAINLNRNVRIDRAPVGGIVPDQSANLNLGFQLPVK